MAKPPSAGFYRVRRARTVALAAAFALCCHAQERATTTPSAATAVHFQASLSPEPPGSALETWLDALAMAESGNRARLVHRDRDGQLYYGCLQFHEKTFVAYVKRFHLLPQSNRAATMRRIYDCAFQKRLAALMIRDDPDNWKHWRGTVEKRIGLPPAQPASATHTENAAKPQDSLGRVPD